jgi:arylformamidase
VVVAYGERDSPEFQRQSRDFAAALQRAGRLRALLVGPGLNHFEMPETLARADGLLGRAALELMGLT